MFPHSSDIRRAIEWTAAAEAPPGCGDGGTSPSRSSDGGSSSRSRAPSTKGTPTIPDDGRACATDSPRYKGMKVTIRRHGGQPLRCRVGMEVLVAFLDGDPDRPICVGCVYNGAHRPPYDLPADRSKSTIRTQSTPGGDGHNELTFDDAAGAERVYIRAQRDLDAHVLHDLNTKVDAAESRRVGGHRHTEVGADDVLHVRKDEVRHVDGAQELAVGGSVAVQIGGGPALGDAAVSAPGMSVSIVQGGYRLTAPQRIELVCGPSAILMTPAGITITGPTAVSLVCGGAMVALAPGAVSLAALALSIAAPGASLGLGATATLASAGGVKLECGEECELTLNGRATIMAGEVMIDAGTRFVAIASKIELDGSDEAVMRSDGLVRLADASGSVVLQGGTIALEEP